MFFLKKYSITHPFIPHLFYNGWNVDGFFHFDLIQDNIHTDKCSRSSHTSRTMYNYWWNAWFSKRRIRNIFPHLSHKINECFGWINGFKVRPCFKLVVTQVSFLILKLRENIITLTNLMIYLFTWYRILHSETIHL